MSVVDTPYYGREQTLVKHKMLKRYLGAAARIIGSRYRGFVYVDCCSGPWKSATDDLSDTSFSIALDELRTAREFLRKHGHNVEFRCLFAERDGGAFRQLQRFCDSISDIEIRLLPGDFTEKTNDILQFIHARPGSFPFFFIDPTGWSPLAITKIEPLLRTTPSEVLINFMTSHIKRFLESSDFEVKFGPDYMQKIMRQTGQDRDDLAAYSFADEIRKFYAYTSTSVVLNPLRDQTHFHLIYGTRHPKGIEKFKEAEKSCFGFMEAVRLDAQHRRAPDDEQGVLFELTPTEDKYLQKLRRHYLTQALEVVTSENKRKQLDDEEAWKVASRFPLVWKTDIRAWLDASRPRPAASQGKSPEGRILKPSNMA
jgi:three-Cys-motif partner protein